MIIGSLAQQAGHGVDYLSFAVVMVPIGGICLAVHLLFLLWLFRHDLPAQWESSHDIDVQMDRPLLTRSLIVFGGVSLAFCLRLNPAWSALAGACVLFILARQRPPAGEVLARLDWSLLLFFAGLFISVHGLSTSGVKDQLWEAAGGLWDNPELVKNLNLVWVSVLGSNVVSNVPFIKLIESQMSQFANPAQAWMLLALATTFAGNLTLLGSVANIIVMETSREPIGFWQYFRVGFPATLLSCVLGTALLLLFCN
jgi:Na+/H+ antiporter NhaD/arsenite permease-like protein